MQSHNVHGIEGVNDGQTELVSITKCLTDRDLQRTDHKFISLMKKHESSENNDHRNRITASFFFALICPFYDRDYRRSLQ